MTNRRGVAMLAALWLVVGITIVAMEFSLIGASVARRVWPPLIVRAPPRAHWAHLP